jgi:hypothetical protein
MDSIRERLKIFIRQYYLNKVLRGSIILGISFIVLLLMFALIEAFGWFNSGTRAFLFYFYLVFNAVVLVLYLIGPLVQLMGLARGISFTKAAGIIGRHFTQIEDKLLNLLQLQEIGDAKAPDNTSYDLLMGAIQQKEQQIKPFPFVKAIEFRSTLKFGRYLVPALILLIMILGFKPDLIREPVYRIRHYQQHFEKPAPFTFVIINDDLSGIARGSYVLRFTTRGDEIPSEAFVEINGINYRANQTEKNQFEFEVQNLQSSVKFRMNAVNIFSKEYLISVIPRPGIKSFKVHLDYPTYTRKPSEEMDNVGDLIVPRGTIVTWKFSTNHADDLKFVYNEAEITLQKSGNERYTWKQRVLQEALYSIKPVNRHIDTLPPVNYMIEVIPDEYPSIGMQEVFDSLNHFMIFFMGEMADDYGFTKLLYHVAQVRGGDTIQKKTSPLPFAGQEQKQRIMHFEDLRNSGFIPGDQLVYYFEVWDNDGITGPKPARTYTGTYKIPGYAELDQLQDQLEEEVKQKMEASIRAAKAIQQEAKKLSDELKNKEQLNWQDREKINQLLSRQQQLKSNIEEVQKKMELKQQKEKQFKEIDPDILEKQKLLQELMEKLLDEDTRKLMEEIQKLMDELNKEKVGEMLDKIKVNNDELNRELDRNLELFKQLEIEKDLRESIQELNKLAEEQKNLSKEAAKPNADARKLQEKQEELNKKFDQISDKLDKVRKNNEELEFPNKLENTAGDEKSIKNEMNESSQQLKQGKPGSASPKQQKASDKMEELSDKLSDMMDDMMDEQIAEDIMTLRLILKNLIHLSFEQEELMKTAQRTGRLDPRYPEVMNKQNLLRRDFQIIEDSLVALGKRQTAIQSVVSKEISAIKDNMEQAISNFLDVHTVGFSMNQQGREKGIERQQFAMTSMNNLALLLAEALDSMRDQQNQQKSGKGKQCKNPKPGSSGKPSMQQLRQRQQSLNQQLQQMRDQMQKGQQPDGKRNSMSEQFARMAAEQEAIRKALGEYMQELQKQGLKDKGAMSELMKQMEKTEEELVNKMLNNSTLTRQEDIRTRLLEHERAERQREEEERRESKEVKNEIFGNPSLFLEYKRVTEKEREMLRYSTPLLQPFYKQKVNDYMIKQEAVK